MGNLRYTCAEESLSTWNLTHRNMRLLFTKTQWSLFTFYIYCDVILFAHLGWTEDTVKARLFSFKQIPPVKILASALSPICLTNLETWRIFLFNFSSDLNPEIETVIARNINSVNQYLLLCWIGHILGLIHLMKILASWSYVYFNGNRVLKTFWLWLWLCVIVFCYS